MSCQALDCDLCRPLGMIEWSAVVAYRMREQDDEGIGGVKPAPQDMRTPFNWWYEARDRRRRAELRV